MKLWDRIIEALSLTKEIPVFLEEKVAEVARKMEWVPNPYITEDEAEAIYETMENGLHATWPLLNASEKAGLLAARGVIWGALYSFTLDEDHPDQNGVAWELARLVQEYLHEDQDAKDLPGVRAQEDGDWFEELTKEAEPGFHRIQGEMWAFMDAAIEGNYQGAVLVTSALRQRIGALSFAGGNHETLEDAEKVVAVSFLGSCLASLATKYAEDEIARGDD